MRSQSWPTFATSQATVPSAVVGPLCPESEGSIHWEHSATTPRHKRCGAHKFIGRGLLNHPSTHGFIRDKRPGGQSAVPVHRSHGTLVFTPSVESGTDEGPAKRRKRAVAERIYHRLLFASPRPIVPGIHMKKRMARLAACPGCEVSSVLMTTMRSKHAANIDSSTAAMFAESKAERSGVVAVTPRAVSTAPEPENASVRAARSARDGTTATREPSGRSVIRSR